MDRAASGPLESRIQTIHYRRVVDLCQPIHPGMPRWPGDPPVEIEMAAELARDGYFLRRFSLGEHSATHLNAPNSFFPGAADVGALTAPARVLPAVVFDFRARGAADPDAIFTLEDLLAWEARHGRVPPGSLALLCTGWSRRWDDPQAFFNPDPDGGLHFPGFSLEAARTLIEVRRVAGLGSDTHGVDPGLDSAFQVNRLVLADGGLVLECLAHLDELPPTGATLVIGTLPLVGGSGSPVSALAFVS